MPDPWVVFEYELKMFYDTLELCKLSTRRFYTEPAGTAIIESMLLHLRILTEILLSRGKETDDIRLKDLLPGFTAPEIGALEDLYGNRKTVGSACWTLNKMLMHATMERSYSYDHAPHVKKLEPVVMALVDKVLAARTR